MCSARISRWLHRHQRRRRRGDGRPRLGEVLPADRRRHPGGPPANPIGPPMTADYSFLSFYPTSGSGTDVAHTPTRWPTDKTGGRHRVVGHDHRIPRSSCAPWTPRPAGADGGSWMRRGGAAGSANTTRCDSPETSTPIQPNVRRYTTDLDADLFSRPHFSVRTSGPSRAGGPHRSLKFSAHAGPAGATGRPRGVGQARPLSRRVARMLDGGRSPARAITIYPVTHPRVNYRTAGLSRSSPASLGAALQRYSDAVLPVTQTTAQLTWPQNGTLSSVTAPLIGYVPTEMSISACRAGPRPV